MNVIKALSVVCVGAATMTGCDRGGGVAREDIQSTLVLRGSTTVLPISMRVSAQFMEDHPNITVSIDAKGSMDGIEALIDGKCDIAASSREIGNDEMLRALERGIKIQEVHIGYDMIVPIVHPDNPVASLSFEQLKGVFTGKIRNWSPLGWEDREIVVAMRGHASGTKFVWDRSLLLTPKEISPRALFLDSNGSVCNVVRGNPDAIGYVGYGHLTRFVKLVRVDGVEPSMEAGHAGKYPMSRKLYLYVNQRNRKRLVLDFLDFILSAAGQELVKEAGYLPL